MNMKRIIDGLTTIAKIVSFISLVMTVVIKTRILLGVQKKETPKEVKNEN
jgi:hypothetical protein